jgi:glycolate oxidase FAD binding subunit
MVWTGTTTRPSDQGELLQLVAEAAASGTELEPRGGGSKRDVGKPDRKVAVVDLSAFAGVTDYEPSELVLTVRPATRLVEVEALLHQNGQMLAFEPWDHGPLFGREGGGATIGGIVAASVSGPRRVSAGGVRDHLLGFSAVSGRGEAFKAGGSVVKNVTGYDVSKVMAGSWGQLAILTELTLKVVPRPRDTRTIALAGLDPETAIAVMARAMGSRVRPAAAAHLPASANGAALTLFRLEGISKSIQVRADQLGDLLEGAGEVAQLDPARADSLWDKLRGARGLAGSEALWRIQIAPSRAARFARELEAKGANWCFDWAGALVWVGAATSVDVRNLAGAHGGHAMLLRAPRAVLEQEPIRHPEAPAVAALSARVRQAFDPARILSPSRFG